ARRITKKLRLRGRRGPVAKSSGRIKHASTGSQLKPFYIAFLHSQLAMRCAPPSQFAISSKTPNRPEDVYPETWVARPRRTTPARHLAPLSADHGPKKRKAAQTLRRSR